MAPKEILWIDDEIEMLKPHLMLLERRGYHVDQALSGSDGLAMLEEKRYDVVFLDENMPGLSGVETLHRIRQAWPMQHVVMVTKSDEEDLMNQAIAGQIADYLIKPVNPNQILLVLKKLFDSDQIIGEATLTGYREAYPSIAQRLNGRLSYEEWVALYKELVHWSLKIESYSPDLKELLELQQREAEQLFSRFVMEHYAHWMRNADERPTMSPDLLKRFLFPLLDKGEKVFLLVIDNFRYDQWLSVKDLVADRFTVDETLYMSILPTATQYARNALFSGMMPSEIAKHYPALWVNEDREEGKNDHEEELLRELLARHKKGCPLSYNKVLEADFGEKLVQQLDQLKKNRLNVVVINFVDMLSHARTESKMIRELAPDEAAYRSLTRSWFSHSTMMPMLHKIADMGYKILLSTDHGTVRVTKPVKVVGDKHLSTNLRYKWGKNMSYNEKEVFEISKPEAFGLPRRAVTDRYIFSRESDFFAYPNNFNYYVSYYRNTFQHGGISFEEMLVPIVQLTPKA